MIKFYINLIIKMMRKKMEKNDKIIRKRIQIKSQRKENE